MGTNFMRIPTEAEMESRKETLLEEIRNMDTSPFMIEREFGVPMSDDSWEFENPWQRFIEGTSVHLGKRSMGWKFIWDFHDNKYYSNKEELLEFIRAGRVINEYGEELDVEEFIKMALEWGEPDGLSLNDQYRQKMKELGLPALMSPEDDDLIIDGLRVSKYENFC